MSYPKIKWDFNPTRNKILLNKIFRTNSHFSLIIQVRPETLFKYISPKFLKMLGYNFPDIFNENKIYQIIDNNLDFEQLCISNINKSNMASFRLKWRYNTETKTVTTNNVFYLWQRTDKLKYLVGYGALDSEINQIKEKSFSRLANKNSIVKDFSFTEKDDLLPFDKQIQNYREREKEEKVLLLSLVHYLGDSLVKQIMNNIDNFRYIRQLETELESTIKKQEKLLIKDKKLSDYIHFIGHDLRNMVASVMGYLDLFYETNDIKYLKRIDDKLSYFTSFINQSVDLVDAGLITNEVAEVNLNKEINKLAKALIPPTINYKLSKFPVLITNKVKVQQIFQNIIGNAVKHGKPSNIWFSFEKLDDKYNVIHICNDGKKIDEKIINKIFNEGFSTTDSTGLGLTIVTAIIETLGWKIRVNSTEEETRFSLIIPKRNFLNK